MPREAEWNHRVASSSVAKVRTGDENPAMGHGGHTVFAAATFGPRP